jgi:hypothetical protein
MTNTDRTIIIVALRDRRTRTSLLRVDGTSIRLHNCLHSKIFGRRNLYVLMGEDEENGLSSVTLE